MWVGERQQTSIGNTFQSNIRLKMTRATADRFTEPCPSRGITAPCMKGMEPHLPQLGVWGQRSIANCSAGMPRGCSIAPCFPLCQSYECVCTKHIPGLTLNRQVHFKQTDPPLPMSYIGRSYLTVLPLLIPKSHLIGIPGSIGGLNKR